MGIKEFYIEHGVNLRHLASVARLRRNLTIDSVYRGAEVLYQKIQGGLVVKDISLGNMILSEAKLVVVDVKDDRLSDIDDKIAFLEKEPLAVEDGLLKIESGLADIDDKLCDAAGDSLLVKSTLTDIDSILLGITRRLSDIEVKLQLPWYPKRWQWLFKERRIKWL